MLYWESETNYENKKKKMDFEVIMSTKTEKLSFEK